MRCHAALFLLPHDVRMGQKRDAAGQVVTPHALVWDCTRCGRRLGETALWPVSARGRDGGVLQRLRSLGRRLAARVDLGRRDRAWGRR
jgi:hypothetical protein